MGERLFVQGNEAVGWGAVGAGCLHFYGYPITPQTEILEWFARELPKRGGVFLQAQCETGAINMVYAAAATGVRVMTATSSNGWSLMQETISSGTSAETPFVVVLVARGGPGGGTIRHSQMDYLSATCGGGHGGYRNIVLVPASVQETHDLMQLAFHLADKYRNPVIVLTDAIIGQMAEPLEVRTVDFDALPEKDWAVKGRRYHEDGQRRFVAMYPGSKPPYYLGYVVRFWEKFKEMEETEIRYDTYRAEDADLLLVAYGAMARLSQEAVDLARSEGIKAGMLRPITVWPFPYRAIKQRAVEGAKFLVVEDSMGQLVEDVRRAVEGRAPVHLLGMWVRHLPTDGGFIFPHRILEEIRQLA